MTDLASDNFEPRMSTNCTMVHWIELLTTGTTCDPLNKPPYI